jgi:uncharacterized protein
MLEKENRKYFAFNFKDKFFLLDIENLFVFEVNQDLFYDFEEAIDKFALSYTSIFNKKKLKHKQRKDFFNAEQPIRSISINVTQICNLRCIYCYGDEGEYGMRGVMDEKTANKCVDFLIKESKNLKDLTINFFGGEPLLNFELIKTTVNYALVETKKYGKKIHFGITTNGTLLKPECNSFFNKNNFSVVVSFDGDKYTQDNNRPFANGSGSYDFIYPKIVEFLKSRNGRAIGRATVTANTQNISTLKSQLRDVGFKKVCTIPMTVVNNAFNEQNSFDGKNRIHESLCKNDESEGIAFYNTIKKSGDINAFNNSLIYRCLKVLLDRNKLLYPCGAGRTLLAISTNGDVYVCHRFVGNPDFKLGNINDSKISSRLKYSESPVLNHETCSICWARFFCGGGCLHDNMLMGKNTNNVNLKHCSQLKENIKHAVYILSNLDCNDVINLNY